MKEFCFHSIQIYLTIVRSKYINSFKAVRTAVASLECSYLDDK